MLMKTLMQVGRWTAMVLIVGVVLVLVDLYTVQFVVSDPGYYVVARRSDTPDQVLRALGKLEQRDFRDVKKLRVLVNRYRRKLSSSEAGQDTRSAWRQAYRSTRQMLTRAQEDRPRDFQSP